LERRTVMKRYGKTLTNFYPVIVDDINVEEAIRQGKYDWINPAITSKNFPMKEWGKAEFKVELIHFDHQISVGKALKELDLIGYRPAGLRKLLALGCQYPEVQREFPIFALGSIFWDGMYRHEYVPYLYGSDQDRILSLYWLKNFFGEGCRFEVVHK